MKFVGEIMNLETHRGRREMRMLGGPRHTRGINDGKKDFQLMDVHRAPPNELSFLWRRILRHYGISTALWGIIHRLELLNQPFRYSSLPHVFWVFILGAKRRYAGASK